jgi:N-carbamoylputrescine amidase
VSVNRCGFEEDPSGLTSGIDFWGSSFIVGPQGELLHLSPDNAPCEVVTDIDMNRSENVRQWWPFLRDRRIDHYSNLTKRFLD